MSLSSSLYTGVGGLKSYGEAMNVIGDNIANVNTVGFKGSRTVFGDILASSLSGGSTSQVGRGSMIRDISLNLETGSIESTGSSTDVAIQGAGFFVLGGAGSRFYTRAGQFIIDSNGLLSGANGLPVQGYLLDANGAATGNLQDIDLAGVQSVPRPTTSVSIGANLDASTSATSTFQSALSIYNSLGEIVTLAITFTKTATTGEWSYATSASSAASASGSLTVTGGTGTLTFDSSGGLTSMTNSVNGSTMLDPTITIAGFTSGTGAADLTFSWDLLNGSNVTNGNLTSYVASSVTNAITQDGFATGTLKGISIDAGGVISGVFSNGQAQQLRQLGMGDFLSPWGLTRMGNSLYAESADSGQPVIGIAGAGGFGSIVGSSLELSNVDLGTEFVSLIQTQRAYQANSRIISTVDEMLAEAVNIKR